MLGYCLGMVMEFCYDLVGNYGLAIILFTLISKIVLLPISIWVQKNSIKMVKMQPEINRIKIDHFGDKDSMAEEESKLYKKYKYSPFASIIPLVVQIILLLGLVQVINKPITYILNYDTKVTNKYVDALVKKDKKVNESDSAIEILVVKDIKKDSAPYYKIDKKERVDKINNLSFKFLGFDLSYVAASEKGIAYIIPLIAGLSALILCVGQNIMNVLQKEQSKANKYGMLILSVGLSLYLGTFVAAGVALYWTASNLFAVLQQWLLNIFINPKKQVNYEELEKTRNELKELEKKSSEKRTKKQIKKEKDDYKKFFKVVNKHLVFYSESNGFYKYYKPMIEYILQNTNITIHYITSDYNDNIFNLEKENDRIRAYYIGEKRLITLMMKMDADVVVMTMPDIETYHIKRSYVRKDINYVYYSHGIGSTNLTLRYKATFNYDTVFAASKGQYDEEIAFNKKYNLNRKIYKVGYPLLDDMILGYKPKSNKRKQILIAPSWQKDNIIDLCLTDILDNIKDEDYDIIVRPHPQHVRHKKDYFEQMKKKYSGSKNIEIQTDFSKNSTVLDSDLVITDWSDIGFEYAFSTKKPVLYINTPMKIMNPNYKELDIVPMNMWARDVIGKSLDVKDINKTKDVIRELLKNKDKYSKIINKTMDDNLYNVGTSAKVGAEHIIDIIQEKIKERKEK
ncbi:MAG: membrane protein insertase YidC [Bacilli bacterium]|nr:membrane protein insertase YidC [Bacilli bacterium]